MAGQNKGILYSLRIKILGKSRWNLFLGILSLVILVGSFSALAFNTLNQKESAKFSIGDREYEWDSLYDNFETTEVQGHQGVPLRILFNDAGIEDLSSHDYKVIGADGYFKTVEWKDMETGIMSIEDKKVVFENKAKAYWVRDVVEIEVV